MNRILVLEGYRNPFGGPAPRTNQKHLGGNMAHRRRSSKRRSYKGIKAQQSKMKSCAAEWRSGKTSARSYMAHMRQCLK